MCIKTTLPPISLMKLTKYPATTLGQLFVEDTSSHKSFLEYLNQNRASCFIMLFSIGEIWYQTNIEMKQIITKR